MTGASSCSQQTQWPSPGVAQLGKGTGRTTSRLPASAFPLRQAAKLRAWGNRVSAVRTSHPPSLGPQMPLPYCRPKEISSRATTSPQPLSCLTAALTPAETVPGIYLLVEGGTEAPPSSGWPSHEDEAQPGLQGPASPAVWKRSRRFSRQGNSRWSVKSKSDSCRCLSS